MSEIQRYTHICYTSCECRCQVTFDDEDKMHMTYSHGGSDKFKEKGHKWVLRVAYYFGIHEKLVLRE